MANRNAFYYVLDRTTGEFLVGAPYAKQTWANGLDEKGRPKLLPNISPTAEGTLVYPSLQGAANWFSPSFDPVHNVLFAAVREMGSYYYKTDPEYRPGMMFTGGGERALDGDAAYGAVRALDALTGETKWSFRLQSPPWALWSLPAGWFSAAPTRAISSRWMQLPARRCGTSRPAARLKLTPSAS